MLFFISPVSLILFASSQCMGHLVTNGYDIFHLSITSLYNRRLLSHGCILATRGVREKGGDENGSRRERIGIFFFSLILISFLPSSRKKKKKKKNSTSLPSPCSWQRRQKYSRGQMESILFPLKSAANRSIYRTRIQTGATSLCSGYGAAERGPLLPEAFSSLPASLQPGRSPPTLRFSPS